MKKAVSFILSIVIVSAALIVESSESRYTSVSFLSTRNSDCIIINTPTTSVMIDTAYDESFGVIYDKLNSMGIEKLDILILTHYDKDHVGSAAEIIKKFSPERIYVTYDRPKVYSKAHRRYINTVKKLKLTPNIVRDYTELDIGGALLKIYPPKMDSYLYDCSNNSSLVVALEQQSVSFLFAADIEELRIAELLDDGIGNYDVLKVPHHGWTECNTAQFIERVSPRYSVVTNKSGRKSIPSTAASIIANGSYLYTTARGEVAFKCYENYYTVSQNIAR